MSLKQESLKRMWQERRDESSLKVAPTLTLAAPFTSPNPKDSSLLPVTVVFEGRSICHRISLHKHGGYHSFARALRQMFVQNNHLHDHNLLDLSNAVPGHLIAYEDIENDLLLVGDLNWKDFIRVARRIRILPAKPKSRKLNWIENPVWHTEIEGTTL